MNRTFSFFEGDAGGCRCDCSASALPVLTKSARTANSVIPKQHGTTSTALRRRASCPLSPVLGGEGWGEGLFRRGEALFRWGEALFRRIAGGSNGLLRPEVPRSPTLPRDDVRRRSSSSIPSSVPPARRRYTASNAVSGAATCCERAPASNSPARRSIARGCAAGSKAAYRSAKRRAQRNET